MASVPRPAVRPFPRAYAPLPRLHRLLAALMLVLLAVAVIANRGAHMALAPTAVDTELYAVHAAVDDLRGEFFRPVKTSDLLRPAWEAASGLARENGVTLERVRPPQLSDDTNASLKSFDASFHDLNRNAAGKVDARGLGHAAVAGVAGAVHENHTYFIDPEHWSHRADTSSSYAGIGITVAQKDGAFYAVEVYAGSPAAGAGVRSGDRFLSVDGVKTAGLTMDQFTGRLRGRPGTSVTVEVQRTGGWLLAELKRQAIVVPAFESRMLDGGVGYLRLRSFPPADARLPSGQTVPQALDAALASFEQAGVTAWVLDLRDNGGGYLDTMTQVAGRLLPAGAPLIVSRTQASENVSHAPAGQRLPARALSVLVNGSSASASEILTVALQESGRASVVGQKSAGVANAADLDALPNGGGLSVTAVQTLTPVLRRPLDGQGVQPDDIVALSDEDVPVGRDRQLDRAVAVVRAGGVADVP